MKVYDAYKEDVGGTSYAGDLDNYSVFIDQYIYDEIDPSIVIEETYYNKDALEVPVFEYACQIDDSDDVIIGDNILKQYQKQTSGAFIYFYTYVEGDNLTQENCIDSQEIQGLTSPLRYRVFNGVNVEYDDAYEKVLKVTLYNAQIYDILEQTWSNGTQQDFTIGKDYAIFRHAYNLGTGEHIVDLMFIAKKVPSSNILNNNLLTLFINHYKLR